MYKAILRPVAYKAYSGFLHRHAADTLTELKESIITDCACSCNLRERMFEIFKDEEMIGTFNEVFS